MRITQILNKTHNTDNSTIGHANLLEKYGLPLTPTIDFSSAHSFYSNKELIEYHNNKYNSLRYNRDSKEIIYQSEKYFENIMDSNYAILVDSGMRAVTIAINSMLKAIDTIYLPHEVYRKTRNYCSYLKDIGAIKSLIIYDNLEMNLNNLNDKSLLILESFSNPHLIISDFDLVKNLREKVDFKIILDSTFAGLCNHKKKFDFIDIEVQSLTKYIGGYNDLVGGVIVTDNENLFKSCWDIRSYEGGILDAMSGYLLIRSLRDYDLRWEKQNKNVQDIYSYLNNHSLVDKVYFPGKQEQFSQNELFEKFYYSTGSVLSFISKIDVDKLSNRLGGFKSIKIAPSFGSIDTLMEIPSIMSHFGKDNKYFEDIKLERNLIRMSIGCEPFELIINDLENLLDI